MSSDVFTIKIAGPAGAGIKSSGLLLSKILLAHGQNLRDYSEYPSLVRGGHNTYQVSFSSQNILAPHFQVNLLFALQPNHWQQHQVELTKSSLVFADDGKQILPLKQMTAELGSTIYANTICLGVAAFILSLDQKVCQKILNENFSSDSPNHPAFKLGYEYAKNNFYSLQLPSLRVPAKSRRGNSVLYDGNESFGWGFISGGGNFYASYPMTPSSGALHFLASQQDKYKIQVHHPEDEIAVASMATGAVFAGARAAVGTSGGGFALMNESVSFCGVANLGVVFYLVSRPGPATGLPTWTAQGDLLHAVNSGHGEFPKIVLAPGNQQESFDMAVESLNLAAKFNVPVILLSDKFISESGASLSDLSKIKSKIIASAKPTPGSPGIEYMANSYEHDDQGFATEDSEVVQRNITARLKLIEKIKTSTPKPLLFGSSTAKKLIISWGSVSSTILETLRNLENSSEFAFLQLRTLWPLNNNIELLVKPFKEKIVIENNATSQLTTLLKSQFDFHPTKTILKSDGRPFFPEELVKWLNAQ